MTTKGMTGKDMSKKIDAAKMIGMSQVMKNGHEAVIVAWRGYDDMDVRFTKLDILKEHVSYQNFKNGSIGLGINYQATRCGEKVVQKCGLEAVIVSYKNSKDINVYFPSLNITREHVLYDAFKKGVINADIRPYQEKRIGEVVYQSSCGMNATITGYKDSTNISIVFEDGASLDGIPYNSFKKGQVTPSSKLGKTKKIAQERVGMTCVQACGLEATITAYRNNNDIDIEFVNGQIRAGVKYDSFIKGKISPFPHAALVNRVGEVCFQKPCGMNATIIAYRNSKDMDVEFENKLIRQNISYRHFKNGTLRLMSNDNQAKCRIGEEMETAHGKCVIVKYESSENVFVKFLSDETIVETTYANFSRGSVRNPNIKCNMEQRNERLGTRKQMASGRWAAVVEYNCADDISVQFEDDVVIPHRTWRAFVDGLIGHPDDSPQSKKAARIGEVREMNNHMMAKIVRYGRVDDVDVEFIEDGAVVKSTSYKQFKNGEIAHPTKRTKTMLSIEEFAIGYYLHRLGFVKIKQGQWADRGFEKLELDFYNQQYNIAIEYDGEIHAMWDIPERDVRKNLKCRELGVVLYRLRHYQLPILTDGNSINYQLSKPTDKQFIQKGVIDCKKELEDILRTNGIPFGDGDINFQRDLEQIVAEYKQVCVDYYENRHIGEISYNKKSNQYMMIIAYRNCKDVDVEFSDKSRRCGVNYSKFLAGNVRHPDYTSESLAEKRLGAVNTNQHGLEMIVINYRSAEDVDVLFTIDNKVRYNVRFNEFQIGSLSHPDKLRKPRSKKTKSDSGECA